MPALIIAGEADLGQFMLTELGPLAVDLGWTAPSDVLPAVEDALDAYFDGAGDIAGVTDQRKLRALARVEAWRMAVNATAADIDSSTDGQSMALAGRHAQAVGRLNDALARAAAHRAEYAVAVTTATWDDHHHRRDNTGTEF